MNIEEQRQRINALENANSDLEDELSSARRALDDLLKDRRQVKAERDAYCNCLEEISLKISGVL